MIPGSVEKFIVNLRIIILKYMAAEKIVATESAC
jgi:hypothetical protein